MKYITSCMLLSLAVIAGTQGSETTTKSTSANADTNKETATNTQVNSFLASKPNGLYAHMTVNNSDVLFELYYQKTPITVMNFVGLATGKFDGQVSKDGKYFDDIVFHRVVDDFVIQAGDPTGTGSGGPGYTFDDEFDSSLRHNNAGILSMANSGPDTNGSQFFVTLAATPHLNNKHSVFGRVLDGIDVIKTISQGDKIQSIKIISKGAEAENYFNSITWESFNKQILAQKKIKTTQLEEKKAQITNGLKNNQTYTETNEGIFYSITTIGQGQKVKKGDTVMVHYQLSIYGSSSIIDSSYQRNEPFEVVIGAKRVIPGWELMLPYLRVGDIADVVIPPELAYGSQGVGPIPPESFLQFKMEVVRIR